MICRFELHIGLYKTESSVKFNWTLDQGLRYSCQEIKSDIDNKRFRLARTELTFPLRLKS
jgi:hypothetical protein